MSLTELELKRAKVEISKMSQRILSVTNPYTVFKEVCSRIGVSEFLMRNKSKITEDVNLRYIVWNELKNVHHWKISQIARFSNRTPECIGNFFRKYAHRKS